MATITVTLPEGVTLFQGKQISFTAPCDSTGVTGIIINNVTYTLLKANGDSLETGVFISGALVSVLIDLTNHKAYIQNAASIANIAHKATHSIGGADALIDADIAISPDVATALGLTGNPQVKDALTALSLGAGMCGYLFIVKYSNGAIAKNITIQGIQAPNGTTCVTNSLGKALGAAASTSVSFSIDMSGVLDVKSYSSTVTGIVGSITNVTVTLELKEGLTSLYTSQSLVVSDQMDTIDICCIGGGGGGGSGWYGGGGGGGGYVATLLAQTLQPNTVYNVTIGAGGNGGAKSTSNGVAGGAGGTTSFGALVSASGGSGGAGQSAASPAAAGGAGNGNGGKGAYYSGGYSSATAGAAGTYPLFNDDTQPKYSGGGGGGGSNSGNYGGGGAPNGGRGGSGTATPAIAGSVPGGGGGGNGCNTALSSSDPNYYGPGASGGSGAVFVKWRHKS